MGTSGFWSFYHDLIQTVPLNIIEGKVIYVDIILYIYKYVIGIRKSGCDIKSNDGKIINHIHAITKIIKNFTDHNIFPVCVFDGKAPIEKEETIHKRHERAEISIEKCNEIIIKKNDENNENDDKNDNVNDNDDNNDNDDKNDNDNDEYIKYFKRSFVLTQRMIQECKDFLDYAGIPYVNSYGEADPQCVALNHYYKYISSGIYSEDSDIILYGGDILYHNLDMKNNKISYIDYTSIINFLQKKVDNICKEHNLIKKQVTRQVFIDFSIIMGNDYCNGVRISGKNNRDKILELFTINDFNMKNFINYILKININKIIYYIPENFLEKWNLCKQLYSDVNVINPININITLKQPNIIMLKQFLIDLNIRNNIMNNFIKSINDNYNIYKKCINFMSLIENNNINKVYDKNDKNDNEWHTVNKKKIKQR
jgi:5'-3' exonuclease